MRLIWIAAWAGAALLSWLLTFVVRRYALNWSVLDIPVTRSSHTVPTPRGGGLAIATVAVAGVVLAGSMGLLPSHHVIALAGGGLVIAGVGWIDDRKELTARSRLAVHLFAALWFLAWAGGPGPLSLGTHMLDFGMIGWAFAALLIVWLTNLYNFMDGIDGLAAGEAVIIGLAGGMLLFVTGNLGLAMVSLAISAASAGFLVLNWAPARIFMGDAGSGFLGFFFATIAILSERAGGVPLLAWLVLLGAFFFDATTTLIRRIMRGEKWREGHRVHAYQRATQKVGSHTWVTAGTLALSVLLAFLAAWIVLRPEQAWIALLAAFTFVLLAYAAVEWVAPMPDQVPASSQRETLRRAGDVTARARDRNPSRSTDELSRSAGRAS